MTSSLTTPLSAPATVRALDLPALVGPGAWARLPPAVRRRFGVDHGAATYVGRMELRCSPVGRVFAALSRLFGSPLSGVTSDAVPTSVRVFDDGRGGMVWERSFHTAGPRAPHVVRSTKQLAADGGLVERTDGGLSMALDVFEERGALVFESRRFTLMLGRLRIPVPALLTPGTCRVTHTDLGDGLFRFDLDMVHPLWGHTFHQSGVFVDPVADAEGAAQ
ncbi:DUF4166 domain-containing protein [Scleromatobacter humisilvae]|uniref:DUF4166 domain-containing protein n=1 Tax=Scleromatobacter humisilvae TaxID=2897159 RepID=A0A9X1YN71_9BURK|nr:DUF4166 domain-containing protein [Scleromatobacter humisilvae]MCK9688060.1 DUF4166 domain-containing protein [Scleromatobacter humisilvae]